VLFVARLFYLVNLRSSRNGLKSSSASGAASYAVSATFGQRDELRSSFLCSALLWLRTYNVCFFASYLVAERKKEPEKASSSVSLGFASGAEADHCRN
jgi:hypothetical protein